MSKLAGVGGGGIAGLVRRGMQGLSHCPRPLAAWWRPRHYSANNARIAANPASARSFLRTNYFQREKCAIMTENDPQDSGKSLFFFNSGWINPHSFIKPYTAW